ncbi:MAG: arginine--tRNA ligase [Elusimicrobia bacterium]|nr:arginine--tRNA ligase [Elusimicrobiota bacterium]
MILNRLRRALLIKLSSWSQEEGLSVPELSALASPPAHVRADVSLPWALAIAKPAKRNPIQLAQALAGAFQEIDEVEEAQVTPPGFLNLRLRLSALCENLDAITASPSLYGSDPQIQRRKILAEFVSANPTGPLHLASGRGATLGDSLARILRRIGHEVGCEYYINDAGGRVELLGQSLRARFEQLRGKESPVPEGGYQGEYLKDLAATLGPEAGSWTPTEFGKYAMERLLAQHKQDMDAFGVSFDRWFAESELHQKKAVERALELLKDRKKVYEKDGAVWLGTSDQETGDDKDRVLVRSDGRPTYFLADIAYHKDKYDRGWSELIDIWGADHHGYVPRMRAAIAALGQPPSSFHPIVHQLIHLYRGQEAVKMSKRAGEFVRLSEVVAEVGRDACRFFFALRTPDSHLNFDLELAKRQTSENPVYYCQYVHARVCSIFREAAKQGLAAKTDAALLQAPEERALLLKLAWFPETLKVCEKELSPHPLAGYILELAGLFHPFYERCRVVDTARAELSRARLSLCAGVRDVIAEGLALLGVSAPEQM